jgi:murein DD-endopeptidase MepM/ murein hydrolase activator NlpD
VLELDIGESQTVELYDGTNISVTLIDIQEERDPIRNAIRKAMVKISVEGTETWLEAGNYNLPAAVSGVLVDCSVTRGYLTDNYSNPEQIWRLAKDARLRIWPEGRPLLSPGLFVYPLKQKWFAGNTYIGNEPVVNDHDATKPYPSDIYYHFGFDQGGCEALTEVLAAADGRVIVAGTDYQEGYENFFDDTGIQPRYDRVVVQEENGWMYRYSHLYRVDVAVGQEVVKGDTIGLLGKEIGAWSHMHFDLWYVNAEGRYVLELCYPYMWEAYVEQYSPPVLAVARPHTYIGVGDTVILDGTKSMSFAGSIVSYEWTFTDGTTATGSAVSREYASPGLYSEALKVTDDRGNVEYDFAQVMAVYEDAPERIYGWIHASYYPTFNIDPGDSITFKARYFNLSDGEETWDLGDGSPERTTVSGSSYAEITHAYDESGHYLVKVSRTNDLGEPAIAHLHVTVGDPDQVSVSTAAKSEPRTTLLVSNNSLAQSMTIRYSVPQSGIVQIGVYDQGGRTVRSLVEEEKASGRHSFSWNGRKDDETALANGVYVVVMKINGRIIHKPGITYVLRD